MKFNKPLLIVLSVFVLFIFVSSAGAANINKTEILSIDESVTLENNLLSVDSNVKSNDTLKLSNDELLTAGDNWYVNSSKTSSGDGKSEATAFNTLKDALAVVQDGNTIMIASGEYKGTNNTNLTINNNLNFIKYGDGEAIFDAEGLNRIWNVNANSINITGLTFKNGKSDKNNGGAIYIANTLINSNINATFINNTATNGGAIYIYGGDVSGTLTGSFNNNTAENKGGAIYIDNSVSGKLTGSFINNTATNGGAIYIYGGVSGNLTGSFINNTAGYGGAIYISKNGISGSLTGSFINNRAIGDGGGAIHIDYGDVSGTLTGSFINNIAKYDGAAINCDVVSGTLTGSFINNTASRGGAIFIYGDVSGSLNGSFINNTVGNTGGAIYFNSDFSGTLTGSFINNIAKNDSSAIYINDNLGENAIIKDSIFINNKIISKKGNITVINSWFGNNATNYNTKPTPGNVTMDNWLFLNATANPTEINIDDTSTITFKLDSYNETSKEINHYDASKINVTIELSQTLGQLNQTTALIGEEVLYAAKQEGNASVTGKIETVFYTVNIQNSDKPTPRKDLNISGSAEAITSGENAIIIVTGFENATGNVTARIQGGPLSAPIVNGTVTFIVPGLTLNTTAYIIYEGDANYNPANTTVNITVYPKSDVVIVAENVTKYYGGPERFVANIYDSELNPLVNKSVNITINGVTYTKKTDDNGTVSMAIRLGRGTYDVTTQVDNTTLKSSITVLSTVTGSDLTKYYKNATQYSVKVYNTNGTAVGKGEVVTFNINGIFYNRTTDENGIATLNINLPSSNYIITSDYKGCRIANNITVLPVLNATDISMKYLDGTQFKVNLVDGQGKPYKDQFVRFNINGKFYDRLTDSNGQAALNIRLPAGEYIITSSFNGANIANKITITS